MKHRFRLTQSIEFKRVRRFGKSYAHPLVVLLALPGEPLNFRIGIAASHNVGGAVERNLVKRRLRACLDEELPTLMSGWNIVLLARQPAVQAKFSELRAAVTRLLNRAGLRVKSDVPNGLF